MSGRAAAIKPFRSTRRRSATIGGDRWLGRLGFIPRTVLVIAALLLITLMVGPRASVMRPADIRRGLLTPYSAPEVINPLRGQYQDLGIALYPPANAGRPEWPGTYDAGDRFLWSELQPTSADDYDFSAIDKAIEAAHAEDERFHFRIMALCSEGCQEGNLHSAVPDWLRSRKGATSEFSKGDATYVVPNWNSDAYLTAAEKLIAALGARYNKDERVEWFEFSGYGDWSENHIGFVAKELGAPTPWPEESVAQLGYYDQYHDQAITKSSITHLVDATLSAFPDTRIVVAAGNPEITRQFLAASPTQPVGIRGDCLGVIAPTQYWATDPDSWYVHNDKKLVSELLARWKSAPVVTEWCNSQPEGMAQYFAKALKDVVNYHVSMVASNVMAPRQSSYDIWERANKYAGYRYAVTSSILPDRAAVGTDLPITLRWDNFGTAPTYDDWDIWYEVLDRAGTVVMEVKSGLLLGTIAAEQNYSDVGQEPAPATSDDTFLLPTSGLPAGDYTVVTKVVWNQHKPGGINVVDYPTMELAQGGRDSRGGYPIAQFRLN